MRHFILIFLALTPIAASAAPAEHGTFARNFAMLAYATKRCPQLRMNEALLAKTILQYGLPKGALEPGGELALEAQAQMSKIDNVFGSQSNETVCAYFEDALGPGGTIAPGFLKRK